MSLARQPRRILTDLHVPLQIRPLLYRVFTKPWFRDVANFATTPLQRDSTPDLLDVLNGVAAPWPASDPDKLEY